MRTSARRTRHSAPGSDGRRRIYPYDELIARDRANLDIFRLKDDSLADSDNLPPPEVIAQEIVDDLEAALETGSLDCGGFEWRSRPNLSAPDLNGSDDRETAT